MGDAGAGRAKRRRSGELNLSVLKSRLLARLDAKRLDATETAVRAGLGKTYVHDIFNGKNASPSVEAVRKIAKVLSTSSGYLTGEYDDPRMGAMPDAPIPIIGVVEAGAFRPMPEFGPHGEHELATIRAPRNLAFPDAKHFSFEVRGDSMNASKPAPIVDGMFALCIDVADSGISVESGRIYVVRRTLDNGQTYEHTIKRAHIFRDRVELRPESTNPRHKPLVMKPGPDEGDASEVRAIGLVYGVYGSLEI